MKTPDRPRSRRTPVAGLSRRQRLLAALLVAMAIPLALLTQSPRSPSAPSLPAEDSEQDATPTPRVRVALHLEEPVPTDTCVVWTAAFQSAWDRMADLLDMPAGIDVGPPADPLALRTLNAGRVPPGVIPARDLQVVAGRSTQTTWAEVDKASDFGVPAGVRRLDSQHFVTFARLRSSMRYAVPFAVHPEPLQFGPSQTEVRSYGLPKDASGADADRMREQVELHVPDGTRNEDLARRVVVVLKARDGERVVISGRPPQETLAATWLDAKRILESTTAVEFSVVDELAIPRVSIRTGRSYDELAPAPIPSIGGRLVLARQDVSLTVDERGADVDAEALLVGYLSMPRVVRYEGPFLIALLASGSRAPYVVAWIGSDDALTQYDDPIGRPPDAAELRAIEGTWNLDAQQSLEATVEHWRRLSPHRSEEIEASAKDLKGHFSARDFRLLIRTDAAASVTSTQRYAKTRTVEGYLVRDGARLILVHPAVEPAEDPDEEVRRREARWTVTRDGRRLILQAQPAGETLVLVR